MNNNAIPEAKIKQFWGRIYKSDTCWYWVGSVTPKGYGCISVNRRNMLAHRLSYLINIGPIPDGMQLDHVCHSTDKTCKGGNDCRHRRCVNPDHLEPVTPLENTSRGRVKDSALDECKHGHKYTPENTRYDKRDGSRICKTCNADKVRRYTANHQTYADRAARAAYHLEWYYRNRRRDPHEDAESTC